MSGLQLHRSHIEFTETQNTTQIRYKIRGKGRLGEITLLDNTERTRSYSRNQSPLSLNVPIQNEAHTHSQAR